MKNTIVKTLINSLGSILFTSMTFDRAKAAILRWEEKQISGVEKKEGVLDELQVIGIKLSAFAANLLVELALAAVRGGI